MSQFTNTSSGFQPQVIEGTKQAKKGEYTPKFNLKATLYYPNMSKPNDMSGKYQVELSNLSDEAVIKLQDLGLEPRHRNEKPELGSFITVKSTQPMTAEDTHGVDVDVRTIGNGTKVIATVFGYRWDFKGKSGWSLSADKIVITELVPYENGPASNEALETF